MAVSGTLRAGTGLGLLAVASIGIGFASVQPPSGFEDLGIGAKVAECRGIVTAHTADGHNLVIANALDMGPTGYVVVTDVDAQTTEQVYCPTDVPQGAPYASILASTGKFYTAQGRVLVEFDPPTRSWTFSGVPSSAASAYLSFTEGPDGTIWAGSVYGTVLISFDPRTRQMIDHGRMDDRESYLMDLAVDDTGWVYAGIGTARGNIVAYNPATGERRQLVPEGDRVHGTAVVYPTVDGAAYGRAAGVSYRLHNGEAQPIDPEDASARKDVGDIYWGQRTGRFPDGRRVTAYDLPGRWLELGDPQAGTSKRIAIDYDPAGVSITSLGAGPGGIVYGSTAHPMHLLAVDTVTQALEDRGPIPAVGGGNFCAIARQGEAVVGAQYSHGRLWTYYPGEPWNPTAANPSLRVTDTLTIEAWVRAGAIDGYGIIATRGSYTYFFALTGGRHVALLVGDNRSWNAIAVGETALADEWVHVAGTYDSTTGEANVYVDGRKDGTAVGSPAPIGDKQAALSIGSAASYRDTYHLAGAIDELRIHARVLSLEEIGAHSELRYSDGAERAVWRFDEPERGSIIHDSSPYLNHGELKNADPSTSRVPGVVGMALSFDGIDDHVLVARQANPRWVAEWPADICRPRTALGHPDGHSILMAGYAGYGLCGGGIGIYDLETGEETLLSADQDLLPGHSPITVQALPGGDLVAGTSVAAPGGGHETAEEAELFVLDWESKEVETRLVPVPGDPHVISILVGPDGLVHGLSSNSTYFVFDPESRAIVHSESFAEFGAVPRHALHVGPDGRIYALLSGAIVRIEPGRFDHELVAETPARATAGGAIANGLLCYASGAEVWTYRLGPAATIYLPHLAVSP